MIFCFSVGLVKVNRFLGMSVTAVCKYYDILFSNDSQEIAEKDKYNQISLKRVTI